MPQSSSNRPMQAAVYREFGGPIRIEHVPIPPISPDGVLVQVMATGVCRSDWHGWKGHDDDVKEHGLPFVPGHELSGIVVRVGRSVKQFSVGDRVTAPFILSCGNCRYCHRNRTTVCSNQQQPGFTYWGSFAEYVAIPRADRNVKRIPDSVSFVQAASLGCRFTTAYRAVKQQGRLQQGESIAIFGAGGVGLSCVMMAASMGANIIVAIDLSNEGLELAIQLGATHVVQASAKDCCQQVQRICGGDGADLCVDAAGFAETCENAVLCTRPAGRMVQVGLPIGDHRPQVPMGRVAGKEIEIIGSHGFAADDLPELLDMVATSSLDPAKLVRREVSLREGAIELENMDKGSPIGITMIVRFNESKL